MKKPILLLLWLLAALLLLAGCGKQQNDNSAGDNNTGSDSASVELDLQEAMAALLEKAPISDALTLEAENMLDFYGIPAEDMTDFAAVTSSIGLTAEEIVLIKASDDTAAQEAEARLKDRLEARKSEFKNYQPDQYDILTKCRVERSGLYVSMILSPQAEALRSLYHDLLAGK